MYIHIYGLHNRIEFVHLGKGLNEYVKELPTENI